MNSLINSWKNLFSNVCLLQVCQANPEPSLAPVEVSPCWCILRKPHFYIDIRAFFVPFCMKE